MLSANVWIIATLRSSAAIVSSCVLLKLAGIVIYNNISSNLANLSSSLVSIVIKNICWTRLLLVFLVILSLTMGNGVIATIIQLLQGFKLTLYITLASFPLVFIGIALTYFDLRTRNLCSEWLFRNHTFPSHFITMRLIGDAVEAIILNHWLPLHLIILFGFNEFMSQYKKTLYVNWLASLLFILYIGFLHYLGVYETTLWYRVPANLMYLLQLGYQCKIVVREIRRRNPWITFSDVRIFIVIAMPILSTFAIAMIFRYGIVQLFNSTETKSLKLTIALSMQLISFPLTAFCRHMALYHTDELEIEKNRVFGLFFFMQAIWMTLRGVLLADIYSMWWFVFISVFQRFIYILLTVTSSWPDKMLTDVIKQDCTSCCFCLPPRRNIEPDSNHQAHIAIQDMLFQNISVMISQADLMLYKIINFVSPDGTDIVWEFLTRIAIAVSIHFILSWLLSIYYIRCQKIKVSNMWSNHWKNHMLAAGVFVTMLVCYFTKPLPSVFHARMNNSSDAVQYALRNCTLPYEGWL